MPSADLIQIVDAALAEAVRKAGSWLACRPGCTACCISPFPITPFDADRLREGLSRLDPAIARRVRERARHSRARLERAYPGDTVARVLAEDDAAEDEPCPALDPDTGTCDLYEWRPITCRTFGPAIRFGQDSLAVCELCFDGATPEEVAACEVEIAQEILEEGLLGSENEETIVAYALTLKGLL
jgi:Fe-S-cluster containining protein